MSGEGQRERERECGHLPRARAPHAARSHTQQLATISHAICYLRGCPLILIKHLKPCLQYITYTVRLSCARNARENLADTLCTVQVLALRIAA